MKMYNIRLVQDEEVSIRSSYTHKIELDLPNAIVIASNVADVLTTLRRYAISLGTEISYLDEDNLDLYVNFNAMDNEAKDLLLSPCVTTRINAWLNL